MEKINHKKIVGDRINTLLAEQNKSQKALADVIGVKPNVISYFCKGTRTPNTEQLVEIADFFKVSTDYLLGRTEVQTIDDFERAVCDYIGLSEEALNNLVAINLTSKTMNDSGISTGISHIFEYLLEQDYISSLLIDLLMLAMGSQMVFTDNEDEKKPNSERNWKEITHDQECDLMRYRMSERFTNLLDEFDRRSINNKEYRKIKYGILDYTDE